MRLSKITQRYAKYVRQTNNPSTLREKKLFCIFLFGLNRKVFVISHRQQSGDNACFCYNKAGLMHVSVVSIKSDYSLNTITMIFNFRLVSDEVHNFKREIQIDASATFLDLKNAICDSVGYKKDELSSFFLCNDGWEKEKEITLEDMGTSSDEDAYLMDECVLEDYIDDEGQKLLFTFDYMTDRSFFIEMKQMITGRDLLDPVCTLSLGTPPPQTVDIAAFEEKIDAKAKQTSLDDFEENFYGEDEYTPEEFEEGGFNEIIDE